ncbi:MAG: zinc-binding dehydrogenase [Bacteroidetes bacterium]|nr:zinc-binding dehydrogenase [Bacteroidota bacterium]
MKAIILKQHGKPETAFEMVEMPIPIPKDGCVVIKAEVSGLNFADVLARNGLYKDAPPPPTVLGYEVVGRIYAKGKAVTDFEVGDRVVAFTRFGGYAQYAETDARAIAKIPDDMEAAKAAALATQYGTAYYGAYELVNLFPGDHVLIHAAAGGVGTALIQLAKAKGCIIYGTAGSDEKLEYLKNQGVDYPINYKKHDFYEEIRKLRGKQGMDVVFDSIGGTVFKKSLKLLSYGGKIVTYGAADRMEGKWGMLANLKLVLDYGITIPVFLLMTSKSILGLNMLRIADYKPEIIQRCIQNLVKLYSEGIINPQIGGIFKAEEMAKAHALLESRKSIGKIVVEWDLSHESCVMSHESC